jgi:rSAM/selenodomain-associated transferase 1
MDRVALFARRPVPGRVKTRLSPALPAALACDLHAAMLADALAAIRSSVAQERYLYWAEPDAGTAEASPPDGFGVRIQAGTELGERLERAFSDLLGDSGRAVIVGADCPELDAGALNAALADLASADLVLGPTSDGGYYLVGLARRAPELFRDIDWSTDRVFAQTLERSRALGLVTRILPPRDDVDTPADLARWIGRLAARAAPPDSRAFRSLVRMGLAHGP